MASFADIEQRVNTRALARLSNCTVTLSGGASFAAIFDASSTDADGYTVAQPTLRGKQSDLASVGAQTLTVRGVSYAAPEPAMPDGTGMAQLLLKRVA